MIYKRFNSGFGVVEILVAAVIVSIVLVGLHSAAAQSLRLIQQSTQRTQASFLLEETIEVLRSRRDAGWAASLGTLSSGTNYYLEFSAGVWNITTTNTLVDGLFERKFVLENVNRDGADDIAVSGSPDAGTKKVTTTVSWNTPTGTITQSVSTYITDMFNN